MDTKVCSGCHQQLPISEFHKNKCSSDGLQAYCKACGKIKTTEYRKANPERMREIARKSWSKRRERRTVSDRNRMHSRFNFINSLKVPCVKCGENRFYVIDFHHIDPSRKSFTISDGSKTHKSKADVLVEVEKCVCLCRNCHKEFHYFYGVKSEHPVEDLQEYLEEGVKDGTTVPRVCADKWKESTDVLQRP